ncbi:carbon-nitrogen hydrolase family protein [Isoptericola halotolerans]|uniref:Amidohydrolase n=1 Tax=Isoptericola halotolerans TaxID=300560 RepID=A0ABX2A487_9MICO|nr:carbon-nitrogen hydrolase family protein [Isoptericola halotolerans]NOV97506.1 putative amidohydrolase [Isoptericola halotolerans]
MTRVTVAQVAVADDHEANRYLVADAFGAAAKVGADLLVLPEYASGYHRHGVGIEHAEPLDGPFVTALRALAERHGVAVVAGTTLPGGGSGADHGPHRAVNAVVAVGADGGLVGVYRKVHLYDAFGTRESDRLEPGPADAEPLTIRVGDLTFGVITCYDLRFPESARRVVDAGADVLLVPAAWVAGPLKAEHWRALLVARAIENTAVVMGVGMAGKGVTGRSLLAGPDGVVGLELDERPQYRTVDLDAAELAAVRRANPSLANRRYTVVPR